MPSISTVKTLGALRRARAASPAAFPRRSVKNEVRDNLIAKLRSGETLFPGIIGYDDTVIPQLVNAILSRHNFILLGLRGQAKSRILRALVSLLDEHLPVVAGCEIHDDPMEPLCSACRMRIMCLVNSALPSTRLAPCATMKGSKPSLRRPRSTSMVGM